MSRDKVIFVNRESVCGFIAAASIRDTFPDKKIDYYYVSNSEFKKKLFDYYNNSRDGDYLNTDLYILDLNAFNEFFDISRLCGGRVNFHLITALASNFCNIFWYDHHAGTYHNRSKLTEAGVELNSGYAEKEFNNEQLSSTISFFSDVPQMLYSARGADDINQNNYYDDLQKIIITSYSLLEKDEVSCLEFFMSLVEDLSKFENVFNSKCKRYSMYQERLKYSNDLCVKLNKDLDNSLEVIELPLSSRKFLIGFADGMLPPNQTIKRLQKEHAKYNYSGILIVSGTPINNAFCVEGPQGDVDMLSFCSFMGGGGKDAVEGGGFGLKKDTQKSDFLDIQAKIELNLNKFSGEDFTA